MIRFPDRRGCNLMFGYKKKIPKRKKKVFLCKKKLFTVKNIHIKSYENSVISILLVNEENNSNIKKVFRRYKRKKSIIDMGEKICISWNRSYVSSGIPACTNHPNMFLEKKVFFCIS